MTSPLRPDLVKGILNAVARGDISGPFTRDDIKKPGQHNTYTPVLNAATGKEEMKVLYRLRPQDVGEDYNINCPFCGDHRKRLYINHAWRWYAHPGLEANYLVHCFNEGCQTLPGFHQQLEALISPLIATPRQPVTFLPAPAIARTTSPRRYLPSNALQLHLTHGAARQFIEGRGYDPVMLSLEYGVCEVVPYAGESSRPGSRDLLLPVHQSGVLVGWQTRPMLPTQDGCKYKCAAGFHKSQFLYNFDNAKGWQFCVVMEGPLDVLRLAVPQKPGPGVAIFGTDISAAQVGLIRATWKLAVVAMDGDTPGREASVKVANRLKDAGVHTIILPMPDGKGPGKLSTQELTNKVLDAVSGWMANEEGRQVLNPAA